MCFFSEGFPKFMVFLITFLPQIRSEGWGRGSSNFRFFPKFKMSKLIFVFFLWWLPWSLIMSLWMVRIQKNWNLYSRLQLVLNFPTFIFNRSKIFRFIYYLGSLGHFSTSSKYIKTLTAFMSIKVLKAYRNKIHY